MDNVVPAGPPSLVLRDLRCPRSAPAPEERRSCRAEPHASRSWQKPGQTVLQSHAGETESSALRQRASSGAQSVIFKEPFGGQEASGEEQWGEGEPPEHLNNKPPHLVLQPEFHAAVNIKLVKEETLCFAVRKRNIVLPFQFSWHYWGSPRGALGLQSSSFENTDIGECLHRGNQN